MTIIIHIKSLFSDHDGAEPSGNSISALNLLKLSILTGKHEYQTKIDKLFVAFSGRFIGSPSTLPTLVSALTLHSDSITSVSLFQDNYVLNFKYIILNFYLFRYTLLVI